MKLELKHLVGYLPYGLKVQTNKGLLELTTIKNGEPEYPFWCETFGDFENEDYNYSRLKGYRGRGFAIEDVIPILRPLSDLTKEIDGVVHFVELAKMFDGSMHSFSFSYGDCFLKPKNGSIKISDIHLFGYLFQHNFDVYGLIERGLAIDVNTIENV